MRVLPPLRIGIPLLLLVFGATGGLVTYYYDLQNQRQMVEEEATERLQYLGTKLGSMGSFLMEMDLQTGAQREVALTAAHPRVRFAMILDAGDRVLFSSRYDDRGMPLAGSSGAGGADLVRRAREKGVGLYELSADRMRITGAYPFPIVMPGEIVAKEVGVALIDLDLSARKAQVAEAGMKRTQVGAAVLLGLTLIFSIIFHRTLTDRVNRLVKASADLAKGNLSARAGIGGTDELATLSRAFDSMAGQIRTRDRELMQSEQRFRQLAENVDEIFWLYDFPSGRAIFVNSAFEKIFGKPATALLESTTVWHQAIHPEDRERVMGEFARERDNARETEYRIVRPDGSVRWLRDRSFPIPNPEGRPERVAGIVQDITTRKLADEERAAFDRKLEETQRLESLGVLAGGIAHDFNNLLTGVLGNASLARMTLPESHESQKYLAEIEDISVRAADLCKQMLAYSGKGRFQVQLVDLSSHVQETTQLLRLSIAKNAVLHFNLASDLPPIEADATQLRQVVMNLVINASEALSGKSGTISLTTGIVRVDAEYLQSTVLSPDLPAGDYVCLEVADNGVGMTPETQARIFEPFFTTKFAGRGLGLSAVLGIVRSHKGAMKVYSEQGKGTMFKLLFPVAPGKAAKPAAGSRDAAQWRGSGTVLVVDDEETVRTVSARMLESLGFRVLLAEDGIEAIEKFQQAGGKVRVVLMDLTMPRLDGEATFRRLRVLDPKVCVVLMSGFNEQEAVNRFTGKGLAGFIQKPFKPAQLAAKLRSILEAAGNDSAQML